MKNMYVYIMTNKNHTTLYSGVTDDLVRRVWEHKNHVNDGFTARYDLHKLVYFEVYEDELTAIEREKKLKKFYKKAKIRMITKMNPGWNDLYENFVATE